MAENSVELGTVSFNEDYQNRGEEPLQVVEIEFNLKSDKDEDDDQFPQISGTISYRTAHPHALSLQALHGRLTKAFREVSRCLFEWADNAELGAKMGEQWRRRAKQANKAK